MRNPERNKATYKTHIWLLLTIIAGMGFTGCSRNVQAISSIGEQATFGTPAEAGEALQTASRAHDDGALSKILGERSAAILSSGDPAEDRASIDVFTKKYDRMNRWVTLTDGSEILYVGLDNYPFPIPLAKNASGKWYFDTAAGEDELLARRIGRNELLAIDAAAAIAKAQELYFKSSHNGFTAGRYAQQIVSTPGTKDGLYWDASEGGAPSPLEKLAGFSANASSTNPQVFHGYMFRILTWQETAGKGGRGNVTSGNISKDFAVIASPVEYADSGIMTFIVSRNGVVYQKDLGEKTVGIAASIKEYNPADGWTPAE
ncbi:MAG: DUF2950 family protein [Terracidiphilus sp.]